MGLTIEGFRKLKYDLPKEAISHYGGSSIINGEYLYMTCRDKHNRSFISRYNYRYKKNKEFELSLSSNDIFSKFGEYKQRSLGQSYPFVSNLNGKQILFFTDWYLHKKTGCIVNRMGVALLGEDRQVDKYEIVKEGPLSLAGAARLYNNNEKTGELYIPIFSNKLGEDNFYNYALSKIGINISQLVRGNLVEYVSEMEKLRKPSPIQAARYFEKSTCLNILPKKGGRGNIYLFAARDKLENYSLYTLDQYNESKPKAVTYQDSQNESSLTYPYYFRLGNNQYLLASTGRYGSSGLSIASIRYS